MVRPALVTGFMPDGGRGVNPAAEIAAAVSFAKIAGMAETLLRDVNPCIVISLGLWPGESLIRVERAALNVADFEIPDNVGYVAADEPVLGNGAAAKLGSSRETPAYRRESCRRAHICTTPACTAFCRRPSCPGRVRDARWDPSVQESVHHRPHRDRSACGFIHVPYLPSQVADLAPN